MHFIQIEERTEPDSLSYQGEYVTKSWMKRHAHNIKEFLLQSI